MLMLCCVGETGEEG